MYWLAIVAVLTALAAAEEGEALGVATPGYRLGAVLCGVAFTSLVAWTIALATRNRLRRDWPGRQRIVRRYHWLRVCHLGVLLGVYGATTLILQWGQLVRWNGGLAGTIFLDELLILAPFLLPLVASWAAFYDVDRALAELSGHPLAVQSRWSYVDYHARHYLAIVFVPVFALVAVLDTARWWPVPARQQGVTAATYAVLSGLLLVFPWVLRASWRAKRLPPGPLRERLERMARRAGFRCRDILCWPTHGGIANALVAGFLPQIRYVLLSDGLLAQFSPEEIEAVFAHEVGHVKHRHLWLRLLCIVPLAGLTAAVHGALPEPSWPRWAWLPQAWGSYGIELLLTGGYLLSVFGYFSRRLERQADIFACRAISCGQADCPPHPDRNAPSSPPAPLPATLCPLSVGTYAGMLNRLADANGLNPHAPSWQHFSIARRVRFLEQLLTNPAAERKFQRSVRRLHALLGVAVAAAVYIVVRLELTPPLG